MKSPPIPSATAVMEFRAATGCRVNESKKYLQTWDPVLIDKVLEAARNGQRLPSLDIFATTESKIQLKILTASLAHEGHGYLVDPIEGDPDVGPIVEMVKSEEISIIEGEYDEWPKGACQLMWNRMKARLDKEHGIEWHSPAELNPSSVFD